MSEILFRIQFLKNNIMSYKDQPLLFSTTITLSIIGSSLAVIVYWVSAVFFTQAKTIIGQLTNSQSMQDITSLFFVIFGALYLVSLIGAIKMWKLQKAGYFFYAGAQILILLIPLFWLGGNAFSSTNTIFTLLFIGIYTAFLKAFN